MKIFMDHVANQDWSARRRVVILSLIWIASLVTYIAVFGKPNSLTEAIAVNLILLFGGIVGSYVFGAVWDTNNKLKAKTAQTAVEQSEPSVTEAKIEVQQ